MAMKGPGGAVLLLLLLAVLAGAWLFRDRITGLLGGGAEPVEVSPEAAARAEEKFRGLRDGEEARLSEVEISSILRYRTPEWAAQRLRDPAVHLSGDTLELSGIVATEHLPSHPELNSVRGLLPDSARVEVTGHVRTLDGGRTAFEISSVEFAGLPIPRRYYADVLEGLGRRDEPGLPANAIALQLPPGARSARVESGHLVLTP